MAKKQGISYSADAGLIRGEGLMRSAGQVDEAAAFGKGFADTFKATQQGIANRNAKIAKIDAKVADHIRGMKGNIDVTGLTAQDQKAVNSFLLEQKDLYANAASQAAKLKPGTPEYTRQVDIMNNINNSFVRLKENLNGYELSKTQYADTKDDLSMGNNVTNQETAGNVFTGQVSFRVDGNGDLVFPTATGDTKFQDIKMPFKKAYEQSLELNGMYESIYNSGGFDAAQQKAFENKLRAMAGSNPEAFKSIAADSLNSYGNYSNITAEQLDDPNLTKEFIEEFIKGSVQGAREAANAGKAKKSGGLNNNKGARTPTPSAIKYGEEIFINGKSMGVYDYGYGYDADGNAVKYYRKPHGDKGWTTTLGDAPDSTTTPTNTTTVPNEYPEWVEDKNLYDDLKAKYPLVDEAMYVYKLKEKNEQ